MSNKLTPSAWATKLGNSPAKTVLVRLADNANDDGYCWPSVSYIAEKTELNERTVRRVLEVFERIGLARRVTPKEDSQKIAFQLQVEALGTNLAESFSLEYAVAQRKPVSETKDAVSETSHPVSETKDAVSETAYIGRTVKEPSLEPQLNLVPLTAQSLPRKKSPRKKGIPWELDPRIDSEAWAAFEEMRRRIRKEMTDYARALIVNKLLRFQSQGMSSVEVLNRSISSSWSDVYELPKPKGDFANGRYTDKQIIDPKLDILNELLASARGKGHPDHGGNHVGRVIEARSPGPQQAGFEEIALDVRGVV